MKVQCRHRCHQHQGVDRVVCVLSVVSGVVVCGIVVGIVVCDVFFWCVVVVKGVASINGGSNSFVVVVVVDVV